MAPQRSLTLCSATNSTTPPKRIGSLSPRNALGLHTAGPENLHRPLNVKTDRLNDTSARNQEKFIAFLEMNGDVAKDILTGFLG
jgi:hypothetical protein